MKILFLAAVLPYPLYSGGQIRIYNLLKRLSKEHEIYLYAFIREESEQQWKKQLNFCKKVVCVYRGRAWQPRYVLNGLVGKYPLLLSTYDNVRMRSAIDAELKNETFDLIHLEPGYVWPSIPQNSSVPMVVAEHNVEHQIYETYVHSTAPFFFRPLMKRDVARLQQWEKVIWGKAAQVIAVSAEDAQKIQQEKTQKITIVPNGVDEEQFTFSPKKEIKTNFQCLFVGDFRWLQNRDAIKFLLEHVWPQVITTYPESSLQIVGRDFPPAFQKFLLPSIFCKERVADIVEVFHQSDILLAPIRIGGGTKYKILEAMATGLPIITTQKGVEGLAMKAQDTVVLAAEPEQWIKSITTMVTDHAFRLKLVKNARAGIEKQYTWSKIAKTLDEVWKETYETNS